MDTLFYKDKNGKIFTNTKAMIAYNAITGEQAYYYVGWPTCGHKLTGGYIKFLMDLLEKREATLINPTVEELVKNGILSEAAYMYKRQNGCSILEARHIVDGMREEYLHKGWDNFAIELDVV